MTSGLAAGIYTTNSAEACLHCAINSQANIIVVENRVQLDKILEVKDRIPSLKAIVQYTGKPHVKDVITVHYTFVFVQTIQITFNYTYISFIYMKLNSIFVQHWRYYILILYKYNFIAIIIIIIVKL